MTTVVAYKAASCQTVNLVLDTIQLAMKKEKTKIAAKLQLHSDQGFHYISQLFLAIPGFAERVLSFRRWFKKKLFSILFINDILRIVIINLHKSMR